MTRPARPFLGEGDACCDNLPPLPRQAERASSALSHLDLSAADALRLGPSFRAQVIASGEDPDRLWCRGCSTSLEELRGGFESSGPAFLRFAATVASVVPGIGSGVAAVLGAAASLAEGQSLSDALVAGALSALPGGAVWAVAGETARGVIAGDRVDRAALAGVRAGILAEGGPAAAAAFDGLMAIAQGKSLQDAGFAGLKALAKGNTLAERAASYSEAIARAAEQGRAVSDVLVSELASDVARSAGAGASTLLSSAMDRIASDPSLLAAGSAALAGALSIPEPIARAAQAVMRAGDVDEGLRAALLPPVALGRIEPAAVRARNDALAARGYAIAMARPAVMVRRNSKTSADWRRGFDVGTIVSQGNAASGPGQDAVLASLTTVAAKSGFLSSRAQQYLFTAAAPALAAAAAAAASTAEVSAAALAAESDEPRTLAASTASKTSPAGDLALGATIAAAVVALVWWRSAK